jgi:hypothetical protein
MCHYAIYVTDELATWPTARPFPDSDTQRRWVLLPTQDFVSLLILSLLLPDEDEHQNDTQVRRIEIKIINKLKIYIFGTYRHF